VHDEPRPHRDSLVYPHALSAATQYWFSAFSFQLSWFWPYILFKDTTCEPLPIYR